MTYDSTISFTLDTICPWTYLAKKRLDEALRRFRNSEDGSASAVSFTVEFRPYQLYPEASIEGEDKYAWYKKSRYGDSEEKMKMYTTLMAAYGTSCGIDFKFGGTVANTMPAHRLVQHYQEEKGPETSNKLIDCSVCPARCKGLYTNDPALYSQYFENEKHPSSDETLLQAARDAGIPESEARAFLAGDEGLMELKNAVREQGGNTDSVPYIVFEGKRRDLTLVGAKEVEEYEKTLHTIVKESK